MPLDPRLRGGDDQMVFNALIMKPKYCFLKKIVAGALLTALPLLAVFATKRSAWGPVLATPKTRLRGPAGARVVIIEYSDFQCPMCAHIQPALHRILDYYSGKIRLAYKYFPLTTIHKNALAAAHAAECAAAQNLFWPYHDRLFATQAQWAALPDPAPGFLATAAEIGLDGARFKICYEDAQRLAPIEADRLEGKRRAVSATPTFFVNNKRLVGQSFADEGATAIEMALKK